MADNENKTLLEEIRDDSKRFHEYWQPIFDEGDIDMRFRSGDPWPPEERLLRKGKRLCLSFDQLGQHVNRLVNEVKSNPRGIKLLPAGDGAGDEDASWKADVVRGIEYRSNAQLAYTWGFQSAVERSYGSWRVSEKFVSDSKFEKELVVDRILNPNAVLLDPYAQKRDFSDMERAFVMSSMSKEKFKSEFPDAKVTSFGTEWTEIAPAWFSGDSVQVGEYWRVEKKKKRLYLFANGLVTETFPKGEKPVKQRDSSSKKIKRYLTNGVEILDTVDWPGEYIPIIPCFGPELWLADGGTTQRVFLSLIRFARDPQMLYSFMRTNEAEEAKMSPKASFLAVEGQLEGHEKEWKESYDDPKVFLYYKEKTDHTGEALLGPPKRSQFIPNFQAYSFAAEDSRRDIQAAIGSTPLPTAAQRQNEKSGVALERIEAQMSKGNYGFIDGYEVALQQTGRIIVPLLKTYYNQPRDLGIQKTDGSYGSLRVNDRNNINPKTKEVEYFDMSKGEYDVTISTGPSFDSQREEATQFIELLVANIKNLPIPPQVMMKVLGLAIRLKSTTLGPIGDKMADLLDPKEGQQGELPPQVMAMIQKLQQESQALNAYGKDLEGQLEELKREKEGKIVDNQFRMEIEKLKIQAQVTIAEINAKAQEVQTRMKMEQDVWNQLHGSAHEAGMTALQKEPPAETATPEGENAPAEQPMELNV